MGNGAWRGIRRDLAQARSAIYGPVTAANPDEHRETARLIQRGQAVPDARFAAKALAYAHFRMLTNLLAALVWLVFAGLLVWWATRGSSVATGKVLAAAGSLLASVSFFWLADRYRRGAKATATAHPDA